MGGPKSRRKWGEVVLTLLELATGEGSEARAGPRLMGPCSWPHPGPRASTHPSNCEAELRILAASCPSVKKGREEILGDEEPLLQLEDKSLLLPGGLRAGDILSGSYPSEGQGRTRYAA